MYRLTILQLCAKLYRLSLHHCLSPFSCIFLKYQQVACTSSMHCIECIQSSALNTTECVQYHWYTELQYLRVVHHSKWYPFFGVCHFIYIYIFLSTANYSILKCLCCLELIALCGWGGGCVLWGIQYVPERPILGSHVQITRKHRIQNSIHQQNWKMQEWLEHYPLSRNLKLVSLNFPPGMRA